MKNIPNLALVLALTVGAANAEITVLDSAFSTEEQTNYIVDPETVTWSAASFGTFDLSGADKLVVTFGTSHSGLPALTPIGSVTFNGVAMTQAVGSGANDYTESAIWYLDNPGSTVGDLVVSMGRAYGAGVTLWALSGTADGVGATASSAGNSTSLTTTGANSLVIAHSTISGTVGSGLTIPDSSMTADGPGTLLDYGNTNDHAIGTGYQTIAGAGLVSPSFVIDGALIVEGVPRATTIAAEFTAAIPEPSPLAVTDFVYNPGANTFDLSLEGAENSAYILVEAADLDFGNPDQSPIPLDGATATVGSLDTGNDTITTDGSGNATVTGVSLGAPKDATFLRAETAP